MTKSGLPKSVRKHIRFEKARIRKSMMNDEEKIKAIYALYEAVRYTKRESEGGTSSEKDTALNSKSKTRHKPQTPSSKS